MPNEPIDTPRDVATALTRIGTALRSRSWAEGTTSGLTPTQSAMLSELQKHGQLRLGELARQIGVKAPTASDTVRVLCEKGLIRKVRDPHDHRAVRLELTPSGQDAERRSTGAGEFLVEAIATLPPTDAEALRVALAELMQQLERAGHVPSAPVTGAERGSLLRS